jgi:hypothetical protein
VRALPAAPGVPPFFICNPLTPTPQSPLRTDRVPQINLQDVSQGGLGSWSLTNMCLAHLMEERRAGSSGAAADGPTPSLGACLLSFLRRFSGAPGAAFDYAQHAVSVRLGGCVARAALPGGHAFARPNTFFVLEDPLTGGADGAIDDWARAGDGIRAPARQGRRSSRCLGLCPPS